MKTKLLLISPALLMFFFAAVVLPKPNDRLDVTAHEWGTFTSVAGDDGMPVPWFSYTGPLDLPCFVYNFGGSKILIRGTVRMETPVLYFYGSRESSVNVKVSFPQGTITEWYPQASPQRRSNNLIQWQDVKISPEVTPDFPTERGASHYYAARETDAAALQVKSEREKFLFYRGIGTFPLPVSARFEQDGRLVVRNVGGTPVDGLIVFDNHAGARRYAVAGTVKDEVTVDFGSLQDNWAGLLMDLERVLISQGLYEKEARAMIETWRDSWFEEGTRLFYIVPRQAVDSILPLDIQPAPSDVARVFVGRMEIITPAIQQDLRQAVAANDRPALQKYGRFLDAIAKRAGIRSPVIDSVNAAYINKTIANCGR